jgi:hypothetical protein
MNKKLEIAIRNNNDLYAAVFEPLQLDSFRNSSIWYCVEKTPPLYSNLVTVSQEWKPDSIFDKIESKFEKENWGNWSIKDSFAVLDLRKFGFEKLFDAKWLYFERANFAPTKTGTDCDFRIVESENGLSKWKIAWDQNKELGDKIFNAGLLDNPKIKFVAGYEREHLVCGCLINVTGEVLGFSNFFAPNESIEYWSDLLRFVHKSLKFVDIVGYERDQTLTNLLRLNFQVIGRLTVWLK